MLESTICEAKQVREEDVERVANPAVIGTHGLKLIRKREERQISIEDCILAALIEGQSSKLLQKFSFTDRK